MNSALIKCFYASTTSIDRSIDLKRQYLFIYSLAIFTELREKIRNANTNASLSATSYAKEITNAKLAGHTVDTYQATRHQTVIVSMWSMYEDYLRQTRTLDFADLLINAAELLRQFPQTFEDVDCVVVDEFQDVNPLMYEITKLLSHKTTTFLTVIGDPNQSIYGFAGAERLIMQKVQEEYEDVALIHLHRSYRCTQEILEAAEMVLFNDTTRIDNGQPTPLFRGPKVVQVQVDSQTKQTQFICKWITEYVSSFIFTIF